jgi:hypothetical protein
MKLVLTGLISLLAANFACAADDLSAIPADKLIDDLSQIDSQAPGLHGTASFSGFIAEDKPPQFRVGILGSPAPKTPPQMRELARRGPAVLPQLIAHLDDKRPTKLKIGGEFFMFSYFSDEYDPKDRPTKDSPRSREKLQRSFDGGYTVKVGDVCYALIGQIVNRSLNPVRYQPTGGLIINSPLEAPVLIERVKKDWGGLDVAAHKASLIADARSDDHVWAFGPALARLRFYYPEDYNRLKDGDLKKQIAGFETDDRAAHQDAGR